MESLYATKLQKHGFVLAEEEQQLWILSGESNSVSISKIEDSFVGLYSDLTGEVNELTSDDFDEVLEWALDNVENN